MDVVNINICLAKGPASLQCNPGGIIGCRKPRAMSQRVSRCLQQNPEVSLDVVNLMVCLWMSPAGLPLAPAESRRYHWMSRPSWYFSGHLQQVSPCLQQNPGGIIGCHEPCGMSLDVSSRSPGVSRHIHEVSSHVVNVDICLAKAPASLQVSPAESRRYHWRL